MEEVKEVRVEDKNSVEKDISSLKQDVFEIRFILNSILDALSSQKKTENQTDNSQIQTVQAQNPTIKGSKAPSDALFSIGNEGVPTDKQTDTRQILAVVDELKTDLKIKFRNLTKQEFKVFSAIYVLEPQGEVDYHILAGKLGLSESSIRDYIMKIERKGILIGKEKVNNKRVLLSIREELKEIAPLEVIMQVREPFYKF